MAATERVRSVVLCGRGWARTLIPVHLGTAQLAVVFLHGDGEVGTHTGVQISVDVGHNTRAKTVSLAGQV